MDYCKKCGGYNYTLIGCCSGRECGCMGQPVDSIGCEACNPDATKEPSDQAKKDYPWFFMNSEEWNEYRKLNNKEVDTESKE